MDELDLPRLEALYKYWRIHPPVHIMVQSYLGLKPSEGNHQFSSPSDTPADSTLSTQAFEYMVENFPTGPAPVYMSSEEYLAKRNIVMEEPK